MVVKCDGCGAYDSGLNCRICGRTLPPEEKFSFHGDEIFVSESNLAKISIVNPILSASDIAAEPSKAAIIVISAIFGPFGAIPASAAAKSAAAKGLPSQPYWKAFWVTWLISSAVVIVAQIIFWTVIIGSINSSFSSVSLNNNPGNSTVLVDCTNVSVKIDIAGTVCQSNTMGSTSWIPVNYFTWDDMAWKWADHGYSCQSGQVQCVEILHFPSTDAETGLLQL